MASGEAACELCTQAGGDVLWQSDFCRVIRVADSAYPGFCRVILNAHVREMTDLPEADQLRIMRIVLAVEKLVRQLYAPDKVNLASFGNVVPHLHWHIIPRWRDDRHFPEPIWGRPQRETSAERAAVGDAQLREVLQAALAGL